MKKEIMKLFIFTAVTLTLLLCGAYFIQSPSLFADDNPITSKTDPEINFLLLLATIVLVYIAFIQLFKIGETGKIDSQTQLSKLFKSKRNQKAISYLFLKYMSSSLNNHVEIIREINTYLTQKNLENINTSGNKNLPTQSHNNYLKQPFINRQVDDTHKIYYEDFINLLSLLDFLEFIGYLITKNRMTINEILGVCGNTILFAHDCLIDLATLLKYKNFTALTNQIKSTGVDNHYFINLQSIVSHTQNQSREDYPNPPRPRAR